MMPKVPATYFDEAYWTVGTKSNYAPYPGPDWWVHKAIAAMLAACYDFPFDGLVLDVGGAFGYHAGELTELTGVRAFVVDASRYAIDRADKRVSALQLDVGSAALPFPTASFDLVASIETLEHVYEPEVPFALGEITRVLKPGAPLYASIALPSPDDATCPDKSHQTMKPREWWHTHLLDAGLVWDEEARQRAEQFRWLGHRPLVKTMNWHLFTYRRTKP